MAKQEGNAHGRHYTDEERDEDAQRNFNEDSGRQHFPADEHQKAGGHSDRHANDTSGQQHEFSKPETDEVESAKEIKPQDKGRQPGSGRNAGGHQGGRNQP